MEGLMHKGRTISLTLLALVILSVMPACHSKVLQGHPMTGYACEEGTLRIQCARGRTIRIQRANYGRVNMNPCYEGGDTSQWDLQCISTNAIRTVNEICHGHNLCSVPADTTLFQDPCPNTPKYLEIQYKCVLDSSTGGDITDVRTRPPVTNKPTPVPTSTTTKLVTKVPTTRSTPPSTPAPTPTFTTTEPTTPFQGVPEEPGFCDQTWIRNISWPRTKAGKLVVRTCPNNPFAKAKWRCGEDKTEWVGHPDLSLCVSPMLGDMGNKVQDFGRILKEAASSHDEQIIQAKEEVANRIVEEVTADMIMVSQREAYGGDLDGVTHLMQQMVEQIDTAVHNVSLDRSQKLVKGINKAVVKSTSNLLDKKQKEAWKDLPQKSQAEAATRVINSVEKSAGQLAATCNEPATIPIIEINIVLEVNVVDTRKTVVEDVAFPQLKQLTAESEWASKGNSIRLSGRTIKEYGVDGLARLIFATYNNLEEFLMPQAEQPLYDITYQRDSTDTYAYSDNAVTSESVKEGNTYDYEVVTEKKEEMELSNVINEFDPYEFEVEVGIANTAELEQEQKEEETNQVVNTNIISASINGRKETKELADPVYYTLEHKSRDNIYNPTCSFWEYEEKTMSGHWSSFGCKLVDTNITHSTCACNHMTNFAVLMDVAGTQLANHHSLSLQLITYIGCIISIICLFICLVTFTYFKNLQCDRNTIHKNLCICLFVAQVIFVAGIVQYDKIILCSIIAGVLHYFLLAAFMWMFLEGLQLYIMLVEVFEAEKSRRVYYYLTGYGVPAVIVGVSATISEVYQYHGYGTPFHCWLSTEWGFIWAFVGPVIGVISVNIAMLSIAIYKMCEHARNVSSWKTKEQTRLQNIRQWMKGAVVLVVLLGLTWSFGLLYFNDHGASVFWAYIFTVLNSLQGFFIFLFHCLLNEKVQKEYKKLIRRTAWIPDCIRAKYGDSRSYTSSTPNVFTSGNPVQKLWNGKFRKRSSASTILNKSSSTEPPRLHDNGFLPEPNGSAIYNEPTEDPGGYLEPVSLRIDSGLDFDNPTMSNIEGSCVESDFLLDYCKKNPEEPGISPPPLDVDKYKIQTPPLEKAKLRMMDDDDESDLSDDDCCKANKGLEEEEEESDYDTLFLKKKQAQADFANDLSDDDTLKLKQRFKRLSSDSGNVDLSSSLNDLNDLNKDDSDDSMNLSAPNINVKLAAELKKDNRDVDKDTNSDIQRSMPEVSQPGMAAGPSEEEAINKLKKALSASDDGLIVLTHGKKNAHRLSKDTKAAMDLHNYRLSSSDC